VNEYDKTAYWIEMSEYDFRTAKWMYRVRRYLYVGFMCHQAVEKMLKARFVESQPPEQLPYTHKLVEIATKAGVFDKMDDSQKTFLRELTPLNIEARYPKAKDQAFAILTRAYTKTLLIRTAEMMKWLKVN